MTKARSAIQALEETLEAMLDDNETITARAAIRRLPHLFKHPSAITRVAERRDLLMQYQRRQTELRDLAARADKQSRKNLVARLTKKDEEIALLHRQRDLLVASHKAMILAVGEMGGMKAWKRFFERYQVVVDELRAIGAMPSAEVHQLEPHRGADPRIGDG